MLLDCSECRLSLGAVLVGGISWQIPEVSVDLLNFTVFFFPRFPSYPVSLQWMLRKGLHFTLQIVFNLAGSSCNGESWTGFLFVWANGFGLDVGGGFVSFPEACWSYWCNGCCWMLQLGVVMFPAVDPPSVGGGVVVGLRMRCSVAVWMRNCAFPYGQGIQVWSLKHI